MDIFEYVREVDYYPNTAIAYRLLFTVPVTVASTERSFFKVEVTEELFEVQNIYYLLSK